MNAKTDPAPRWDDLAAFLAVARAGGLSGAARALGTSPATLGRRMHALERGLGRDLFVRRSHGYDLTGDGRTLQDELESVAAQIDRITARPAEAGLPLVKLSAGSWTALHLARHIGTLAGTPADLRLRFLAMEGRASIGRREAVIGLRNQRPEGPGLAVRRLGRVQFAAYGRMDAPEVWIRVEADTPSARWVAAQPRATVGHEASQPRLALDLALAGAGQVVLPTFIGDAENGLVRRGGPIAPLAHDQWLVTHGEDRALPEVRRALDRIAGLLGRGG